MLSNQLLTDSRIWAFTTGVKVTRIEMYKILTGKYVDVTPKVLRVYDSTTGGNVFDLNKGRAKYDLRKFYFTNRVVNAWNSLPDRVVLSETVNTFKSRLDKFWQHQDMIRKSTTSTSTQVNEVQTRSMSSAASSRLRCRFCTDVLAR